MEKGSVIQNIFSLENFNYNNKVMSILKREDGGVIIYQDQISKEQVDFYHRLYEAEFYLLNQSECFWDKEEQITIERGVNLEEMWVALKQITDAKKPGCDGLTTEFYKKFWEELKLPLKKAFDCAYEHNCLSHSMWKGIISLIPKKDRNLMFLKNWRPITLLNINYKILSKLLTNRMKEFLPDLIRKDQAGFMAGRNIATNIRKTMDVINYVNANHTTAVIMAIDYEKCFDEVEFKAIEGTLRSFNFGPVFIKWIHLPYEDVHLATMNNGYCLDWFMVTHGLFQGNPVATYLYLICGETMANLIRANSDIKGIRIKEVMNIISQFADDTNLYLEFDNVALCYTKKESLDKLLEIEMLIAEFLKHVTYI